MIRPLSSVLALLLCASASVPPTTASVQEHTAAREVTAAERAFARSMADRDLEAFATFVSPEAVFFGESVLRGRDAVVEGWRRFFQGDEPPFAWEPEHVEVLASGALAHSSGPIFNPAGERIGTFNSVWRLESDGRWQVVFDKGCSCGG